MIYAYTGLPGSGKTLTALEFVLSELAKGRHVYTNIVGLSSTMISWKLSGSGVIYSTSYVERYLHRFSMSFSDDAAERSGVFRKELNDFSIYYANAEGLNLLVEDVMRHNEAVVVLDECHEYLAAENWKTLRPFAKYISMARHYGHDLILITQHIMDIWPPLQRRIHETHDFFRGQLGFKTHYRERVYYGCNVIAAPGYSRNKINDKSLYHLYKSHDNGANERLGYMSIWKNRKLVAFVFLAFFFFSFSVYSLYNGIFNSESKLLSPSAPSLPAPEYSQNANVVYVKYVVCGAYDCKATRPDGSVIILPLDYASGKYPVEVRKYVPSSNSFLGNVPGVPGSRPGVSNAPR